MPIDVPKLVSIQLAVVLALTSCLIAGEDPPAARALPRLSISVPSSASTGLFSRFGRWNRRGQGNELGQNPIDRFIFTELEKLGLAHSPPASRVELIRRVTFDLAGLPALARRGRRVPARPPSRRL